MEKVKVEQRRWTWVCSIIRSTNPPICQSSAVKIARWSGSQRPSHVRPHTPHHHTPHHEPCSKTGVPAGFSSTFADLLRSIADPSAPIPYPHASLYQADPGVCFPATPRPPRAAEPHVYRSGIVCRRDHSGGANRRRWRPSIPPHSRWAPTPSSSMRATSSASRAPKTRRDRCFLGCGARRTRCTRASR